MRTAALPARTAALLTLAGSILVFVPCARGEAPPPPTPVSTPILSPDSRPEAAVPPRSATAMQLFAAAEEAWAAGDAEGLAALVDTTRVRIGVKPGSTPTAATTRSAATFLFQDQLRLVTTQSFQVLRMNVGNTSASATARWVGDWGGRDGVRKVTVTLNAVPVSGRWCLREVRVKG